MSVPEFAELLGTSAPTARRLLDEDALPYTKVVKGKRTFRRVARSDADAYLAAHGPFQAKRGRQAQTETSARREAGMHPEQGRSLIADFRRLQKTVSRIQGTLDEMLRSNAGAPTVPCCAASAASAAADADAPADVPADQRAHIVALEEALRLQRMIIAMNAESDAGRAKTTALLLEALAIAETTDQRRREAIHLMDQMVGIFTSPGHPGQP